MTDTTSNQSVFFRLCNDLLLLLCEDEFYIAKVRQIDLTDTEPSKDFDDCAFRAGLLGAN